MNRLSLSFLKLAIFCFIILCNTFLDAQKNISSQTSKKAHGDIKLLVLIIASDDFPVYPELQKIWRSYMHNDEEHVEAYFIRAKPDLASPYEIKDDVIWIKSEENLIPGILNKTVLSIDAFLPRIQNGEFDYVLRTNLSSFYVFPQALEFLKTCARNNFYCAVGSDGIGSGCGFFMSPDVAAKLAENKKFVLTPHFSISSFDDIVIGQFFRMNNIPLTPCPRVDIQTMEAWEQIKENIPLDVFHFRVKNPHDLRLDHDVYIQSALRKMFYKY
jgi:hypothetical protein